MDPKVLECAYFQNDARFVIWEREGGTKCSPEEREQLYPDLHRHHGACTDGCREWYDNQLQQYELKPFLEKARETAFFPQNDMPRG